jgi:hypothetical protein
MPQTRKTVRPVLVDYVCDECGQGKMRPAGIKASNPPQHIHRCNFARRFGCEAEITSGRQYPYTDYIEVDEFGNDVD